jgi:hypothetical protein
MKLKDMTVGQEYLVAGYKGTLSDATRCRYDGEARGRTRIVEMMELDRETGQPKTYGSGSGNRVRRAVNVMKVIGLWAEHAEAAAEADRELAAWKFDTERLGQVDTTHAEDAKSELARIGIRAATSSVRASRTDAKIPAGEDGTYYSRQLILSAGQADKLSALLVALSDVVDITPRADGTGWDFEPVAGLSAPDLVVAARPDGFPTP